MEKKGRYFEIRTGDGKPILSFYLLEREIAVDEVPINSPPQGGPSTKKSNGQGETIPPKNLPKSEPNKSAVKSNGEEPLMSDSQKRFLFRLLADKAIDGERAHEHLKKLFQVNALKEVTKREASQAIERLLEEKKGVNGHGSLVE